MTVFTTHMCIPMPLFSGHLSPTSHHFYPLPIVPLAPKLSHFSLFNTFLHRLTHIPCFCYTCACSTATISVPQGLLIPAPQLLLLHSHQTYYLFCKFSHNLFLFVYSVFTFVLKWTTCYFSASTTTTSSYDLDVAQHYMGHLQSAHFSSSEPVNFPPTLTPQFSFPSPYPLVYDQSLSFQHVHIQLENQPPIGQPMYSVSMGQSINTAPMGQNLFGMPYWQPQGLSQNDDRTAGGAWMRKKIAREQRKLARQMGKSSSSGSESNVEERLSSSVMDANMQNIAIMNKHLYTFCTPDGTKLRELLIKTLKASDVGSPSRIVIPKREAEENLPALSDKDKEGTQIELKDVYSDKVWSLKYKYWSNIRSRMYLLDNTGEFVKHYKLQIGDSITLYEDELQNLKQYVVITKVQQPEVEVEEEAHGPSTSKEECEPNTTYIYQYLEQPYVSQAKDEGEEGAFLALLIQELNQKRARCKL